MGGRFGTRDIFVNGPVGLCNQASRGRIRRRTRFRGSLPFPPAFDLVSKLSGTRSTWSATLHQLCPFVQSDGRLLARESKKDGLVGCLAAARRPLASSLAHRRPPSSLPLHGHPRCSFLTPVLLHQNQRPSQGFHSLSRIRPSSLHRNPMSYEIPATWEGGSQSAAAGSSTSAAAAAASSQLLLEFDPLEEGGRQESPAPAAVSSVEAAGETALARDARQAVAGQAEQGSEAVTSAASKASPTTTPSPSPPELPSKLGAAEAEQHARSFGRSASGTYPAGDASTPTKEPDAGSSQPAPSSLITAIAGTFAKRKAVEPQSATSATAPELPAKDQGATPVPEGARPVRSQSTASSRSGGQVQFDFNRFLEQLKSRPAEPVAKYLKSSARLACPSMIARRQRG